MLQKANSNKMSITFVLQLHLRLNSLRLLHPNRPFKRKRQSFLRVFFFPRVNPCCAISPDRQAQSRREQCPDVDEEEELSNGLPWAPTLHQACSPLLCSCLCTLTLGLKLFGGSVPGRTTKTGGYWGPAVVEVRDNQDRSLLHVQNILFFLWQPHNSQCNYPSGRGAR